MSESSPSPTHPTRRTKTILSFNTFLLSLLAPVLAAAILFQLDSFDPAPLPTHEFSGQPISIPKRNPRLLQATSPCKLHVAADRGLQSLIQLPRRGVMCHLGPGAT
ncbi:hypothetical protein Vadar_031516 [Vaccinium darrowii]|uniref:Uncharacterized protein n=1 Tax=Vaccinium darrowii TaxID=229202 RepID=A0ACB7YHW8_9ERIC|nr:hypothetical protein Vadar_031516 [Vaccinium darrowii]